LNQRQELQKEVHLCAFCVVNHSQGLNLGRFTVRGLCECQIPGCPHESNPRGKKR
jgi:hypothetical protein